MKNVKLLFGLILFISIATTSCKKDNDYFYEDQEEELIDFENETETNQASAGGALTLYKIVDGEIIKSKDFNVSSDLLPFQKDVNKHQQMWDFFRRLIPENERQYITEFEVFYGNNDLAGYVVPVDGEDLSRWKMGLAIDLSGDLDNIDLRDEFTYVCIHEYAHILTLNPTQIDAGQTNCNNYELDEGCAKSNSYINKIYDLGWKDIMNEFQQINSDNEAADFYYKYESRFVTEYAASNPAEDVAEVFTVFVTQDAPPTGNTIADQKVKLMYEYPELVNLRNQIRSQPVMRTLKPGSWVKGKKKCSHTHAHAHSAVQN